MSSIRQRSDRSAYAGLIFCLVSSMTVALFALPVSAGSASVHEGKEQAGMTQIRIVADGVVVKATLNESATSQDFIAMLPMTITLKDYAGTEVVGDLRSELSLNDAPDGYEPKTGDITHYAPWGNLAIFYRDFGYSSGLVPLGRIQGDVSGLVKDAPYQAVIELDQ